ncbi:hypothetical protein ARNL5_03169 [Anaerolineae bacterium]|nr:hypothetical protein ARNL5_03169 [Anaerolineae bacterium]
MTLLMDQRTVFPALTRMAKGVRQPWSPRPRAFSAPPSTYGQTGVASTAPVAMMVAPPPLKTSFPANGT